MTASNTVKKGDQVGWGVLYVEEDVHHDEEQLVICYLTVNRKVLLVRVVYQPPGGFYPLVILPQGVDRVQLDFGATVILEHPITEQDVKILVEDAKRMIAEENEAVAEGRDPHDLYFDNARLFRPLPGAAQKDSNSNWQTKVKDKRVGHTKKTNKMASVVVDVLQNKGKKKKLHFKDSNTALSSKGDQTKSKSCQIL